MDLVFEAGRIAQARGWQSPQVITADLVDQQPPGGGQVIVLAEPDSIDVGRARTVAALIASGTDLLVVAAEPLPAETAQWVPETRVHVAGAVDEVADSAHESSDPLGKRDRSATEEVLVRPAGIPDSPDILLEKGVEAYDAGDIELARHWLQQAAERGQPFAMQILASMAKDAGELGLARHWWQLAADAGLAEAMFGLGILAAEAGDADQARHWYQQGADRGNSDAMVNLGLLAREMGDLGQARRWLQQAVDRGDLDAMFNLGLLAREAGDLGQARRWWQQAAQGGDAFSMFNLGVIAQQADDLGQARFWYQQASDRGLAEAKDVLRQLG